jgi:PIN domain nuclease of toxin-antitoxin system
VSDAPAIERAPLAAGGVAEPSAAVTDTHPLVYHSAGGQRLGKRAARLFEKCESREAILYVPVAVVWEYSQLVRSGRLGSLPSPREFFDVLFSNPAYQPFDLTTDQVLAAHQLGFSRDPFDGLIVSAALAVGLPLVTRDVEIVGSHSVDVLW